MPSWTTIYAAAFWPLLVGVCGAAIVRGDRAIGWTAIALLLTMIMGQLSLSVASYSDLEEGLAVSDVMLMIALLALTIKWPRGWLMAMSAIQVLMVLGHVARWSSGPTTRLTYAILTGSGAYLELALLAYALLKQTGSPDRRV